MVDRDPLWSELEALGAEEPSTDTAQAAPEPEAGLSETARQLDGEGYFDGLARRHGAERQQRERAAVDRSADEGLIERLARSAFDPQEWKEIPKQIPGGAISFGGSILQAPDVAAARLQHNAAGFGQRQIEIMDRIDRGEAVPDMDDPTGYQHMTPEQRATARSDAIQARDAFNPTPIQDRTLFRAGEAVQRFGRELIPAAPGYEEGWGAQVGQGLGSLVAGLPFGIMGRLPAAGAFGSAGVGEATQRAVQFDRAERAAGREGLSQEQIIAAGLLGVAPGLTDLAPIEIMLGRLKVPGMTPQVAKSLAGAIGQVGGRIFFQSAIEGGQEAFQQFLQNVIAWTKYNPDQPLSEGVLANFGVGSAVGGIAQTGREALRIPIRRGGRASSPAPESQPRIEPSEAANAAPTTQAPAPERITPAEIPATPQIQPSGPYGLERFAPAPDLSQDGQTDVSAPPVPETETPALSESLGRIAAMADRPEDSASRGPAVLPPDVLEYLRETNPELAGRYGNSDIPVTAPDTGLTPPLPSLRERLEKVLPKPEVAADPAVEAVVEQNVAVWQAELSQLLTRLNVAAPLSDADARAVFRHMARDNLNIQEATERYGVERYEAQRQRLGQPETVGAAQTQGSPQAAPASGTDRQPAGTRPDGQRAAQLGTERSRPAAEAATSGGRSAERGTEQAANVPSTSQREFFSRLLKQKKPLKWSEVQSRLRATPEQMESLRQDALNDGLLRQDRHGVYRRTAKVQAQAQAGMASLEANPNALSIPVDVRIDNAIRIREAQTGKPVSPVVRITAIRLLANLGASRFTTILSEAKRDGGLKVADVRDLAALVGYPPTAKSTKAEAFRLIAARHLDQKGFLERQKRSQQMGAFVSERDSVLTDDDLATARLQLEDWFSEEGLGFDLTDEDVRDVAGILARGASVEQALDELAAMRADEETDTETEAEAAQPPKTFGNFLRRLLGRPQMMAAFRETRSLEEREAAARAFMETPEWIAAGEPLADESLYTKAGPDRRYIAKDGSEIVGAEAAAQYLADQAEAAVPAGVAQERQVFFVIGYPGSGKSTIARALSKQFRAAHMVSDIPKAIIPEYEGGKGGEIVDKESSELAKAATDIMVAKGDNIIIETLGSWPKIAKRAGYYWSQGYEPSLVFIDTPKAVAMERAVARYERGKATGSARAIPAFTFDLNPQEAYANAIAYEAVTEHTRISPAEGEQGWRTLEASGRFGRDFQATLDAESRARSVSGADGRLDGSRDDASQIGDATDETNQGPGSEGLFAFQTRPYSQIFQARSGEVASAIQRELERMVPQDVPVRMMDRLMVGPAEALERVQIRDVGAMLLDVSMAQGADKAKIKGFHGVTHVLREAGLWSDAEWNLLVERANKTDAAERLNTPMVYEGRTIPMIEGYRTFYTQQARAFGLSGSELTADVEEKINQELVAALAESWAEGTSYGKQIDTLLDRILKFFEAIRNALNGLGFQTADDIFERVVSGEVARRAEGGRREPTFDPFPNKPSPEEYHLSTEEGMAALDVLMGGVSAEAMFAFARRGGDEAVKSGDTAMSELPRPFPLNLPGFNGTVEESLKASGERIRKYFVNLDIAVTATESDPAPLQRLQSFIVSEQADGSLELSFFNGHENIQQIVAAIESDIGNRLSPKGWLTPQGYRYWQSTDPQSVRFHQNAGDVFGGMYASPRAVEFGLAVLGKPDTTGTTQASDVQFASSREHPVAAATRYKGEIFTGTNHGETVPAALKKYPEAEQALFGDGKVSEDAGGFVTNLGRYVTRKEALALADAAGLSARFRSQGFDSTDLRRGGDSPVKSGTPEMSELNKLKSSLPPEALSSERNEQMFAFSSDDNRTPPYLAPPGPWDADFDLGAWRDAHPLPYLQQRERGEPRRANKEIAPGADLSKVILKSEIEKEYHKRLAEQQKPKRRAADDPEVLAQQQEVYRLQSEARNLFARVGYSPFLSSEYASLLRAVGTKKKSLLRGGGLIPEAVLANQLSGEIAAAENRLRYLKTVDLRPPGALSKPSSWLSVPQLLQELTQLGYKGDHESLSAAFDAYFERSEADLMAGRLTPEQETGFIDQLRWVARYSKALNVAYSIKGDVGRISKTADLLMAIGTFLSDLNADNGEAMVAAARKLEIRKSGDAGKVLDGLVKAGLNRDEVHALLWSEFAGKDRTSIDEIISFLEKKRDQHQSNADRSNAPERLGGKPQMLASFRSDDDNLPPFISPPGQVAQPTSPTGGKEGDVRGLTDIIEDLKETLGLTTTQGRYGLTVVDRQNNRKFRFPAQANVRGQYDRNAGVARIKIATDIDAIAHEGGHHLERVYGAELDALKQAHAEELGTQPATNAALPPLSPTGFSGLELDADTQGVLVEASTAMREWRTLAAERASAKVGKVFGRGDATAVQEAAARAATATGTLERRLGTTIAQALIADILGDARVGSVIGVSPLRQAVTVGGNTHLEIAPQDMPAYVMERYSRNGTPQPRNVPTPTPLQISEGFAEFFRRYIVDPDSVQRELPGIYTAFENFLDAADPALLENLEKLQLTALSADYKAYRNATAVDRGVADVATMQPETIWEQVKDWYGSDNRRDRLKQWISLLGSNASFQLIDRTNPILKTQQALLRLADANGVRDADGRPISLEAGENAHRIARMMAGADKIGHQFITHGIPDYQGLEPVGSSLHDALVEALGGTSAFRWSDQALRRFGLYLEARRAIAEWPRYQAGEIPSPPTRRSFEENWQIIQDLEKSNPSYKSAAQKVYDWQHRLLTLEYQAGKWTKEAYEELSKRRNYYVPFMRDLSDLVPTTGGPPGSQMAKRFVEGKRFQGSQRDVINPIESLVKRAYEAAAAVQFNDMVKALANLSERAGPGGAGFVERVQKEELLANNERTFERIRQAAITNGIDPADAQLIVQQMEMQFTDAAVQLLWDPDNLGPNRPPIVPLWENGERKLVRLNDPIMGRRLFDALNAIGREQTNIWIRAIGYPAAVLRAGVTMHPAFIISNILADMQSAFVLTGATPVLTQAKGLYALASTNPMVNRAMRAVGITPPAIAQLYSQVGGISGGQNTAALRALNREYDLGSLRQKGYHVLNVPAMTGLFTAVAGGVAGGMVGGVVGATVGASVGAMAARAVLGHGAERAFVSLTEASETATRLGVASMALKRVKKQYPGISDVDAVREAAFTARDVIDFDRAGAKAGTLLKIIPFLGANIQGVSKAYRQSLMLDGERGRINMQKAGLFLRWQLTGTGGAQMRAQLSPREQQAVRDGARAWVNMMILAAIGVSLALLFKDDPEYDDVRSEVRNTHFVFKLWGTWFRVKKPFELAHPANMAEAYYEWMFRNDPRLMERIAKSFRETHTPPVVPQTFNLITGWRTGVDPRTQRPIVHEGLSRLPAPQQYGAYSSAFAIGWAQALEKVGVKISPMVIDWTLNNELAYWGREVRVTSDYFFSNRAPQWTDVPVTGTMLNRFTVNPSRSSASVEEFWKIMGRGRGDFDQAATGYDNLLRGGNPGAVRAYLAGLSAEERTYAVLQKHFSTADKAAHPLNRANSIYRLNAAMRREMADRGLISTESGERGTTIDMAPAMRAQVDNILGRLAAVEAWNALHDVGRPGWAAREIRDPQPVIDELRAASVPAYEEMMRRRQRDKIADYPDARERWAEVNARINEMIVDDDLLGLAWDKSFRRRRGAVRRMEDAGPRVPIVPQPSPSHVPAPY